MEKALEELRQKSLSMVAENLEYFNCCKKDFAVSECKLWINKIFDRVNEELEEAMRKPTCGGCNRNRTSLGYCSMIEAYTADDFGCNEFIPKEK